MFNVLYAVCSAAAWAGFLYKLRDLRRDPRNPALRTLCLLFAFPAIAFAVAAPAVYVAVGRLLGQPNIATLIVYSCIILCGATYEAVLLLWSRPVEQAWPRIRWRALAFGIVLGVLVVLFSLGTVDDGEHPLDFDVHYATAPFIAEYLVLYYLAFAVAMADIGRLCRHYSRLVGRPWLRRGLRLIAAGALFGLGYSALKIISVAGHWIGLDLSGLSTLWAPVSASVGALLISTGITLPGWGPHLGGLYQLISHFRAYRRLHPLWLALYQVVPAIALDPPAVPRLDRWNPMDLRHRLYRRIIEIRDGRLALRDYLDPHVAKAAQKLGQAAGLSDLELHATMEAAMLHAALNACRVGHPLADAAAADRLFAGGEDLATELAWLTSVAVAFVRSPIVVTVSRGVPCTRKKVR